MRDAEGFDEFYRRTSRSMLRYGYALTGSLAEAKDLVQEAYVRAWQRWRHLRSDGGAEAWVRLFVTRLAADDWRRPEARRAEPGPAGPPDELGSLSDDIVALGDDTAALSDDTVLLVAAMRRLPAAQLRAIALYHLCDLSVADIAAETGAAPEMVESWLSRGRAELAAALDDPTTEANDVG